MSLISPKNFTAPFTNRVHLIALVLTAILFGAFRIAGGSVTMRERSSVGTTRYSETAEPRAATSQRIITTTPGRASSAGRGAPAVADFDALLRDAPPIPGDNEDDAGLVDEAPAGRDSRNQRGLDDIEKQLGLR